MALILNLETSTKNCSVGISLDGKNIALCEKSSDQYIHAEFLHLFIQWAFEATKFQLKDIEAVCVGKGPGSYTGLRIGVSAAKGICYALNKPLIAIDSLDILGYIDTKAKYIVPMIDARRAEVYTAVYDTKHLKISKTEAKVLDENSFTELRKDKCLFLGDGVNKAIDILNLRKEEFKLNVHPSAEYMGGLAENKFKQADFEDLVNFEPYYLKDFVAGK